MGWCDFCLFPEPRGFCDRWLPTGCLGSAFGCRHTQVALQCNYFSYRWDVAVIEEDTTCLCSSFRYTYRKMCSEINFSVTTECLKICLEENNGILKYAFYRRFFSLELRSVTCMSGFVQVYLTERHEYTELIWLLCTLIGKEDANSLIFSKQNRFSVL